MKEGIVKVPPKTRKYFHRDQLVAYETDAVMLVPAGVLGCTQAALVAATGCTLEELGET